MKHFTFTLFLTMLLSVVGTRASAEVVDGINYILYGADLTATVISNYEAEYEGAIVIPSSVSYGGTTYSVTNIGYAAFYNCTGLTSIEIPNSVTSISDSAFSDCSGLTSVTIPNSVTSIGIGAFAGCSGLTSIEIPNSVTSIDFGAFSRCDLTSIVVKDGNAHYDSRNNCNAIIATYSNTLIAGCKNTVIPNSVTSIGGRAFFGCSGLTSIDIPNSVTSIGNAAFHNTAWYNNQPEGLIYAGKFAYTYKGTMPANTSITIKEGTLGIADNAFSGCSGLTSIEIPNSVTSIGRSAFSGCSGLTSIEIPNSVTSIGYGVFSSCSGLTSISVNSGNAIYDSRNNCNAIIETSTNTLIAGYKNTVIPNSVTSIGDYAFAYCKSLTSIEIPNSVTSIGDWAFEGCDGLTSIEIPNSVTSIGNEAFYNCSGLTSITIDNSVTNIGERAFQGCTGLTSIEIPNSVTSIGNEAFYNCSGLTSVTIGNSVTSIGDCAFQGCSGLTSITIGNSVTSIGILAFFGCSGLTSIDIPNSVTSIGSQAFWGTAWYNNQPEGLIYAGKVAYKYKGTMPDNTSITIKEGTLGIADDAFAYCKSLTSIDIPNSVTSIGILAFSGCSGLTSITIDNSVTNIGERAFYDCRGLTSIEIPNSVTSIGIRAFYGCSGLTSISVNSGNAIYDSRNNCNAIIETSTNTLIAGCKNTVIPNGVTRIDDYAFRGCSGLTSIDIPNSVTNIGERAFFGCSGLTSITIPNSVTSIGYGAFCGCTGLTSVTVEWAEPININNATFFSSNIANATLYVPKGCKAVYEAADYWKEFKEIVEIVEEDITPITESEEINFNEEIDESTDLSSVVIDNIYITVDATNSDGYDATKQALVLNSTTSDDQMNAIQDAKVGDASLRDNYNGIVFELASGKGVVSVDVQTIGTHVLMVQIGKNAPTKVTKSERGTVDVPYDVKEPTYVYLYARTDDGSAARLNRAPVIGDNSVLLYSFKVIINGTGIDAIRREAENGKVYDLSGRQVKNPRKGLFIINGKKMVVK